MTLLENPFVLFLLALLVGVLGWLGSRAIDRLLKRFDGDAALAARLAIIEVTLAHVTADQEAHKSHDTQLALLDRRMSDMERELGRGLAKIDGQNRAIWKKLNEATPR